MEKRRLGRTEHKSSVVILGGAAFCTVSQEEADRAISVALEHGVNHIDIAPSYGDAELRLGPWMKHMRSKVFLGCKTGKRTGPEAKAELERSLERLQTDYFDLYQLHGLDKTDELEIALGPGGAVEAIMEAKAKGLVRYIGITGHLVSTHVEALGRFDFDTVLFPWNFVQAGHPDPRTDAQPLFDLAEKRDVGLMAMKAWAKQPWKEGEARTYRNWYRPFDEQDLIDRALWYTLSQPVAGCTMAGDVHLIPMIVDAAERCRALSAQEQAELVELGRREYLPLFPRNA